MLVVKMDAGFDDNNDDKVSGIVGDDAGDGGFDYMGNNVDKNYDDDDDNVQAFILDVDGDDEDGILIVGAAYDDDVVGDVYDDDVVHYIGCDNGEDDDVNGIAHDDGIVCNDIVHWIVGNG